MCSLGNDSMLVKGTKYHWKKMVNILSDQIFIYHLCPKCGLYIGEQKKIINFPAHKEETPTSDCNDREQKDNEQENEVLHCGSCNEDIFIEANYQLGSVFLYFSLTYQLKELFENSDLHQKLQYRNVK